VRADTVFVREVAVEGSTIFTDADFAPLFDEYLGTEQDLESLLRLREALTNLYLEAGYATSAVRLPPQDFSSGTVRFVAVEGTLESVRVRGVSDRGRRYIQRQLTANVGDPLRIEQLSEELQLLQQSPRFDSIAAELVAGDGAGETVLVLDVTPASRVGGSVGLDNYSSPSVGTIGGTIALEAAGLLVFADRLETEVAITGGLLDVDARYVAELGPSGTTATLAYESGDSRIVEEPFDALDIEGEAETIGIELARPLLRRPNELLTARIGFDLRRSRTFLFEDEPFSFAPGPEDGESRTSVLRLGLDYVRQSPDRALGAAMELRVGLPVFDATRNSGNTPDGEFVALLAQTQVVQVLGRGERGRPTLLVARVVGQLATDELLAIERIAMGGPESVRGFRTNERVTDSAVYANFDLQFPVGDTLVVGPFLDVGTAWNASTEVTSPQTLVAIGASASWRPVSDALLRLDVGVPLVDTDNGDSLQEAGVTFLIEYGF